MLDIAALQQHRTLIVIAVILIVQIGLLISYQKVYFGLFMDLAVVSLLVLAAYFVYRYLEAIREIPPRASKLINPAVYNAKKDIIKQREFSKLQSDPRFQKFLQAQNQAMEFKINSRNGAQNVSKASEWQLNKADQEQEEAVLQQFLAKETQIFDDE